MEEIIRNYKANLISAIDALVEKEIIEFIRVMIEARDSKKSIYIFGNGGSGSTASHMVCDILKGCSYEKKKRFKILSLNDNIPTLLAYSNDVGYDRIFLEQVKNYLEPEDVVIGISGSGNSKNVINAIQYANECGAFTVGFTGFSGGKLKEISKYSINANIDDMQISEDLHVIVMHIIYKILNSNN